MKKFRLDHEKMNSRETFGYRDIQISIRFANNVEARAQGVDRHICEVQLHLSDIYIIKKHDAAGRRLQEMEKLTRKIVVAVGSHII